MNPLYRESHPHAVTEARPQAPARRPAPTLAHCAAMAVCCLVAAGALTTPAAARAQGTEPAERTPARARFDVPAGPLAPALRSLAGSANVLLSFTVQQTEGRRTAGVSGQYTFVEALSRVLAGTGLQAEALENGGYVLRAVPVVPMGASPGVATLGIVRVTAGTDAESSTGIGQGFLARRSAAATKTDTRILESPQSISVITRDEMDARDVRDVAEAVAYTAGVNASGTGETTRFGGSSIKIRGFGGTGTAGVSFNEYLDGLRLTGTNFVAGNLDPWLLERIDVLKGPASVLFGQTQPGGVVNMVSKRPTNDAIQEIRIGTGTTERWEAAFDVGRRLNDNVRVRLVGVGVEGDLQQERSERTRRAMAPSLTWDDGQTALTLLAHYQHDDIQGTISNALPYAAVIDNPSGRIPLRFRVGDPSFERWDRKVWSAGYALSHDLTEGIALRQNLRYTRNDLVSNWLFRSDLDPKDLRTLTRSAFTADETSNTLLLDNQLEWKVRTGAVAHTWLAGVDYQRLGNDTLRGFESEGVPSIDAFATVFDQPIARPAIYRSRDTLSRQIGLYLQNQMTMGQLSMVIGGRYDRAKSVTQDRLSQSEVIEDTRDRAFTGRLGAIYNFANGVAPYASYAESFEPIADVTFDGAAFKPLEGRQYEIGVKYEPPGKRQLLTLSAFNLTQKNGTTPDPVHDGFSIQTGEVRIRGLELEAKAELLDDLTLTAAYTYLHDKITQSNESDLGKRRPQVPTHTASLWADYAIPVGPLSGLSAGVGVRRVGKTEADASNTLSVAGYTLVDMALRYDLGRSSPALRGWRAELNVKNLFDRYYVASCMNVETCYLGVGRSARVSMSYRW